MKTEFVGSFETSLIEKKIKKLKAVVLGFFDLVQGTDPSNEPL